MIIWSLPVRWLQNSTALRVARFDIRHRQWDRVSVETTENARHLLVLYHPLLYVLREHYIHDTLFRVTPTSASTPVVVPHLLIFFTCTEVWSFWSLLIDCRKNFILCSCRQYSTFRQLLMGLNQILVCSECYQARFGLPEAHILQVLLTIRVYALYGCSVRVLLCMVSSGALLVAVASVRIIPCPSSPVANNRHTVVFLSWKERGCGAERMSPRLSSGNVRRRLC